MKYWVFQSNQVTGPYDPSDITQIPGYSGETLVCPEGRRGTNMGDWQRAGMLPELSASLLKASQLAATLKSGGGFGALPPEPTLKDLAALGSLQEKVSLLDSTVSHLQESLRLKEDELLSLHKELEDKSLQAGQLAVKLGDLEDRLSAVATLKENLDKALASEREVASTVHEQAQALEEMKVQLQTLKEEQRQAEAKLDKGPIERFPVSQPSENEPPAVNLQPEAAAPSGIMPLMTPPPPAALPSTAEAPPLELPPMPAQAPPAILPVATEPAKKGRGKLVLIVIVLAMVAAAGALKMGVLGGGKKRSSAPVGDQTPLPPPSMPVEATKAPSPEEILEEQKKLAIEAVKAWPTADGATIGARLESASASQGGLSPWMADQIKDGLMQVNFYTPKTATTSAETYEFEVSLTDNKVLPHNQTAADILKNPAVAKTRKKRPSTAKIKAKDSGSPGDEPMLRDLLSLSEEPAAAQPTPTPAAKPIARKAKRPAPIEKRDVEKELTDLLGEDTPSKKIPTAKQKSLDELLALDSPKGEAEPQAEASAHPDKSKPKKAGEAADAKLLDDLLEP